MPADCMITAVLQAVIDNNIQANKFEFLIYLMPKSVSILLGKIERNT